MRVLRTCAVIGVCFALVGQATAQAQRNPERSSVGKLGQLKEAAPIYERANTGSRVLSRGDKDLYIILRDLNDNWATIVMVDGRDGYVEARFVERLPYDVNVQPQATQQATRGNFERSVITGTATGSRIVQDAMQFIGTPYVWGGNSLTGGVDCSGYVQQLFLRQGIRLPRTAQEQSYVGQAIDRLESMQIGDRLYFTDSNRQRITHTGIYIGNGYFIHSSRGRRGVQIDSLQTGNWLRDLINVRR